MDVVYLSSCETDDSESEGKGINYVINNNTKSLHESLSYEDMCELGVVGLIDCPESAIDIPASPPLSQKICHSKVQVMHGNTDNGLDSEKDNNSNNNESFIKRRKIVQTSGVNLFDNLSDEIVLQVFAKLPQTQLGRLALVCKRFRALARDESLWPRFDLAFKVLKPDTLYHVLSRGVKALRLAFSSVHKPAFYHTKSKAKNIVFKIEYLDLSSCHIALEDLESLLLKCPSLKKLSLEFCDLSDVVCSAIAQCKKLDTLNMTMSRGLTVEGLDMIVTSCKGLEIVNLSWCNLSQKAVSMFCQRISPTLKRINFSGALKNISNSDVEVLSRKCNNLLEIDLSDCIVIKNSSIEQIALNCPNIQSLSLSRCYKLSVQVIQYFQQMKNLARLNVFGSVIGGDHMQRLRQVFPHLAINEDKLSDIARPTVGIRRTSIWGIRCRE